MAIDEEENESPSLTEIILKSRRLTGRPAKYETNKQLKDGLQNFLEYCQRNGIAPTNSGACVSLGITRETWSKYQKEKKFSDTIKEFRSICENYVELGMMHGTVKPAAGIFNLCNNYKENWQNTQNIDHTTKGESMNISKERQKELDNIIKQENAEE